MGHEISLALWQVVLLALLALWAVLDRVVLPGARWYLRRRVNRVIEEVNRRLALRIEPFRLTRREVLIDRLVFDPEVVAAAEAWAAERGATREEAMARATRYAREIVPAFNAWAYFGAGYRLARALARTLYRVRLAYADEQGLAGIGREASVVFVMNHRSNMDYILVAYLVARHAALSYAVGEWARVWPVQTLVRSLGAYFVRRGSGDPLYRRVLARYVHMATRAGVVQAVYPEGGLTRDGRLRAPRLGLLAYMLAAFEPAGGRDLVFVPVGINYDRVLEDRSLLLGEGERRRGAARALAVALRFAAGQLALMLAGRWYRFGYAGVGIGTPLSLRAWLAGQGADLAPGGREALVERLAGELMARVGAVVPALPVSLVASVLLAAGGEALGELELKGRVGELIGRLVRSAAHVHVPRADQDYAVACGLRMLVLRRAVERSAEGLYRARPSERALLAYYANAIAHLLPGAGDARIEDV